MPKLSVIVPVYNTEKYLRECIDSILTQTFTDFELILVDDGSTDQSGEICDEYAEADSRVRVVHQNNCGVTAARKMGAALSEGEYITYVDSDDWIDKDMYRIMLEQDPADILICNMITRTEFGANEAKCYIASGYYDKQKLEKNFYPSMLFDYSCCGPAVNPSFCNKLIRKEIILNVINNVEDSIAYGEDALCTYACMLDAEHINVIDKALYHYHNNPSSVCNTYDESLFSKMIVLGEALERLFVEHDFSDSHQLYGYMARHSLECIRNELLFHSDVGYGKKRKKILDYIKNPLIFTSFCYSFPRISNFKVRFKIWLVKYKMIGVLNVLFLGRRILTRRKK